MRSFLFVLCLLSFNCSPTNVQIDPVSKKHLPLVENKTHLQEEVLAPFYHGVASGDPRPGSVVIWRRVTPKYQLDEIVVNWEVALDQDFEQIIEADQIKTSPRRDYTVKKVVAGLKLGTRYYYPYK